MSMQYEPVKRSLVKFISGPLFIKKLFYLLLDILLLRAWHIRRELKKKGALLTGNAYILDAGSGLGQYTWRMCRMNRNWNVTGVDIDREQAEQCRQFFRRAGLEHRTCFFASDLTSFRDPDAFDLILSVDVMEHIRDDEKVFSNFHASMKPEGYLIVSTPSDKGGSDAHNHGDSSFIDEHVRNGYSIHEITEKLSVAGFRNIEVKYTYGRPGNISWRLSMKYPVKMLNISYIFFIILPFYYLLVLPVSVILNYIDVKLSHGSGTGLLVTARK